MQSTKPQKSDRPRQAWLWPALVSLCIFGLWGLQSKIVSEQLSPATNQVLTTPGVLAIALIAGVRRGKTTALRTREQIMATGCAFLTGVLGILGNMTFYEALGHGGKAAIVVPLTSLYPTATLALAALLLRERVTARQWIGIVLSVPAILLLGM